MGEIWVRTGEIQACCGVCACSPVSAQHARAATLRGRSSAPLALAPRWAVERTSTLSDGAAWLRSRSAERAAAAAGAALGLGPAVAVASDGEAAAIAAQHVPRAADDGVARAAMSVQVAPAA